MKLSKFGQKITSHSGILDLMDDLGKAMASNDNVAMLGGGNPAHIPEVINLLQDELQNLSKDKSWVSDGLATYNTPRGNDRFLNALAEYINSKFKWNISPENLVVTPGSQAGFFMLFNMIAGVDENGVNRQIHLPIEPEYIGYFDQGITKDMFKTHQPKIHKIGEHEFKYQVDLDNFKLDDHAAAICISRPTNPTGNVISKDEIDRLREIADNQNIPFILDNAYGLPFPAVIDDQEPIEWSESLIYSMSLSKVGLPAVRNGVIIANKETASLLSSANAIVSLANPNIGQMLMTPLLESGQIDQIVRDIIQPYYAQKASYAKQVIEATFGDDFPWRLHSHQGSFFFWLWLENLPISTKQLYQNLKKKGVVVVPGEYFFLDDSWEHSRQCLRLNIARPESEIDAGIKILKQAIVESI